jgi:hypothetical protein
MKEKLSDSECELIGAIIGDGHIHKKHPKYYVGITGNIKTDKEYFNKLSDLINKTWDKNPQIKTRERGLRLRFYSKQIVRRLTEKFDLPFNFGKCYKVKIPSEIALNWNFAKHTIRGIVDTDGSIFTANKPGSPNYPSIEITTSSKGLARQLRGILIIQGFKVAKIWKYKSKAFTYKIPLNGKKNLKKWVEEIGFSNPYKLERAIKALS